MPTLLTIVVALVVIYASSLAYVLLQNVRKAKKSGFPYVIVPWDQNHFLWMLSSVPLRPWLRKNLPTWLYDRVTLTIYGFEFYEGLAPYLQYAAPQGNDKSYALVTFGKFEIATRDPEITTEILRRVRDFRQVELSALFMARFGRNVLTSDGDAWARQRKVVASTINERISRTVFNESVHQTEGLLDEVLSSDNRGESNRVFDMMKKITINVISGAGMGANIEWKDDANEKPQPGFKMTYIEAVKHVIDNVTGPIILPKWFLANYPSFLPGYHNLNRLGYAVEEFPTHTWNLLNRERQRGQDAHGETRSNIIAQLLQANQPGDGEKSDTTALSDDEVMGNLFIFTAAGFDTTVNTLSFALVLLCRHPQWQEWICEEIDQIMPADSSQELDYTTIFPKATRVLACMLEVLRLFAPVIHISRETKVAQTITTSRGSFYFPPKTTVYLSTGMLHIDPAVWRNLNLAEGEEKSEHDELKFRPTRWFNPPTESQPIFQPPKGSYVPWSGGPRVCPGQKMAQVEFTAIFLKLFHQHRIEAVPMKSASGDLETRAQLESRLDARLKDSISILTLQMNNIYDVGDSQDKGLNVRLAKRK
ncbi:cytochrome P450 monooxygenase-like protein [Coleophoma cylindrospora]|uniref:Cytochrome P450 monooxygenase-like protein n=1 Tax=Coleophoma cylindrospora TaxID=1849047 RepID=A0A3D8S7D7_9HELO|nr:cytochrome P450 monooxygenase-like protein [Coleophoma cylindrospora]